MREAFDLVDYALARIDGVSRPSIQGQAQHLTRMASWLASKKDLTLDELIDQIRSEAAKPALLLPAEPSLTSIDIALPRDDLLIERFRQGIAAQGLFVASRHLLVGRGQA